ncbi:MAG TPA: hypothetical protein VIM39_01790, partial [Candidatus Limnocylindrales bacterium]
FHARSDAEPRPPADDLVDETIARIQRFEPRWGWFTRRGLVATATALGILVAVAAFGVATLGPSIRPAASSSPSATASVLVRSAPAPGLGVAALPLLDVVEAVAIRDAGVDDREIRVQGFFPGIPTMFCPVGREPLANPTRIDCDPTRITQNRVPLSMAGSVTQDPGATLVASFAIVGWPAVAITSPPIVVGTSPAPPADPILLMTLVGHFDDRRADLCGAEEVARCRDTFMVDRIDAEDGQSVATATFYAIQGDTNGISVAPKLELNADIVDRLVLAVDPSLTILSRQVQAANLLQLVEPPTSRSAVPPPSAQPVWSVTAMTAIDSDGRASTRTFHVDDRSRAMSEITRLGVEPLAAVAPTEPRVDCGLGSVTELRAFSVAAACPISAAAALAAIPDRSLVATDVALGNGYYCTAADLLFAPVPCPMGIGPAAGATWFGTATVSFAGTTDMAFLDLYRDGDGVHAWWITTATPPMASVPPTS